MKLKILLIGLLLFNCASLSLFSKKLNVNNPTELVRLQSKIHNNYLNGHIASKDTIRYLETMPWIIAAEQVAPSNIVIRNLCLLDLLEGKANRKERIIKQINILSYYGTSQPIHSEGYSYWLFAREILDTWVTVFNDDSVKIRIKVIDDNFIKTSYLRDGIWYPAPFGDLTKIPLAKELQTETFITSHENVKGMVISKTINPANVLDVTYQIKAWPIGMNIHIPLTDRTVNVVNGEPVDFVFYTGLKNKYPNYYVFLQDMTDPRRLSSIPYDKLLVTTYLKGVNNVYVK